MKNEISNQKYEQRIVLFLDILGFTNLINSHSHKNPPEKILKVFAKLSKIANDPQYSGENNQHPLKLSYFSDTIIISSPVQSATNNYDNASRFILMCLHWWWSLLQAGILTRGGISYGSIIHDNIFLIGPALIEAYEMEKIAKYPRILVSPEVYRLYKNEFDIHYKNHPAFPNLDKLIKQDALDGYHFINMMIADFASPMFVDNFQTAAAPSTVLNQYLEDNNKKFLSPSIQEKHWWLQKNYLN